MKKSNLRRAIASILTIHVAAHTVNQAAQAAESESYTQLDEVVVVATKFATPYAEVAATVTTIDTLDIEQTAAASLRDVLQYIPGVNLRRDPSRFGYDSISIRGIGGNRVAVLVDGIPTTKGFGVGSYSDSGRPLPELDNVQRIEILRGPASALYGSDAIGGVVSIATLGSQDLLRLSGGAMATQLRAGYRSDVDEWRAGLDWAVDFNGVGALFGYTHRDGGEIGTTGSLAPNPRDARSDALTGNLVWDDAPGGRMRLIGSAVQTSVQTDVNSLVLSSGRFANTTALLGDDSSNAYRLVLDQSLQFTKLSGEWRLYWTQTEMTQDSDEDRRATPPSAPDATNIDRLFNMDSQLFGGELTLRQVVEGEQVTQRWVYGVAASYAQVNELRDGLQTNQRTQASTNVVLGEVMPVRDFPISKLIEAGVYVQDDIQIGARWSVIPALRFDYYDLSPDPDAVYLADNTISPAVSVRQESVSPKIGTVYQLGDSASLFAQYAHGFRAQPMEDVNIGLQIPTQNIRAIPNPDLQPEKSNSFEVGARIEAETLHASLSAFYTDYNDFIESKRNIGRDPQNPAVTLFQSQNIAHARIYGVEVDANWRLQTLSDALRGFSIAASATWTQGEDTVQHVSLNSVNPAEGLVKIAYESGSRGWGGDVIVTCVAAKDNVVTPATALVPLAQTSSYTTVDAYFHLRVANNLKVDLGIVNLFDRQYQIWSDVRERPVTDPQLPLYYQPGRSVSVAIKWLF